MTLSVVAITSILLLNFLLMLFFFFLEYHAVGSNVTLHTGYGGNDLVSVDWDHGENNAVKWFENKFTAYSIFKGKLRDLTGPNDVADISHVVNR